MRRAIRLCAARIAGAVLLCACLQAPVHAAADLPPGWDPERFISTAELRPGMQGVGYSVFEGTTIEAFDVEIIGVLYKFAPGRDAIIARISGRVVDVAGVIQGMSGSPIYFDGRLAGALAFGWSFMSEPICGITPIQHMLPLLGKPGAEPQGMATPGPREPLRLSAADVARLPGLPVRGAVQLDPLATPISLSGLSPELVEHIRPWFEALGLVPMASGGNAADYGDVDPQMEPGAALSVPLIEGDMTAAGIGTVTYVEDGNLIGFGHAFRYAGPVALPFGNAMILGVLPNQMISRKIGVSLRTMGYLKQDWQTGIAGTLGAGPPMIPLAVSVQGPAAAAPRAFAYRIAPDRDLVSVMMATAGATSVNEMMQAAGPYHAQVDLTIRPRGYPPITTRSYATSRGGAATPVGLIILRRLQALLDNPYGRVALDGVDLTVSVQAGLGLAYLEEVRPRTLTVRPGESLPITIVYRRHEEGRDTRLVTLDIPSNTPDGTYVLVVSDAARTRALERRRAPMRFRPTTLEQFLELLDLDFPENELTITLLSPRPGMAVHGQELARLPGSVLNVMSGAARRDLARPTRGTVVAQVELPLDMVITGAMLMRLKVDRHAP